MCCAKCSYSSELYALRYGFTNSQSPFSSSDKSSEATSKKEREMAAIAGDYPPLDIKSIRDRWPHLTPLIISSSTSAGTLLMCADGSGETAAPCTEEKHVSLCHFKVTSDDAKRKKNVNVALADRSKLKTTTSKSLVEDDTKSMEIVAAVATTIEPLNITLSRKQCLRSVLCMSAQTIAQQLCLLNGDLYSRVKMREFYQQCWTKQETKWQCAPHLSQIVN
jgi:hypothetical protein